VDVVVLGGLAEDDALDVAHVDAAHTHRRPHLEPGHVAEGRVELGLAVKHVALVADEKHQNPRNEEPEGDEEPDLDLPVHAWGEVAS